MNNEYLGRVGTTARPDMAVDAGLRTFMLGIYNKMAIGLVISGILAYVAANVPAVRDLLFVTAISPRTGNTVLAGYTILGMGVVFAPLVMGLLSMFMMRNPSPAGANVLYWAFVATIGLSLGAVFLRYVDGSVYRTFFITAAAFGGLSLWGYTTKKDLTGMGTFLIMGVFGLIIAGLVNLFLQSPALHFAISAAGVLIFAGLIAFDTQRLKFMYYDLGGDERSMAVATTFGALSLYLNFINLFQFLLQFLGQRE